MKIRSIRPSLYHLSYFKYVDGDHKYSKISSEKSQYVYRILLINEGTLDVWMGGKTERIEAGDALYLLPGEIYRLFPCGKNFSLYSLFFDFCDERSASGNPYNTCVFMQHFRADCCSPRIAFEDATVLNKSGIFKHIFCEKTLGALLYKDREDVLYDFHGRAMLFSILSALLASEQKKQSKNMAVQQILDYIRRNPEKDLSGDALSTVFSYHKNHINKLIKQETGISCSKYIRHAKIEYAKTLLSEEAYSLTELSMRLGYYDYSHFYKAFSAETGMTPVEYIKTSHSS